MGTIRSHRWVGWVAAAGGIAALAIGWAAAAGRHDYIGGAVRSGLFVKSGLISAGAIVVLLALLVILARCGRTVRQARSACRGGGGRGSLTRGDDGTAMAEFALVFPVMLSVVLILVQAMLMMAGAFYVNYAAYAAARSAVVWVPKDLAGQGGWSPEPENQVVDPASSQKCYWIKMAAAVACLPTAGTSGDPDPTEGELQAGIAQYYQSWGNNPPNWVQNFASRKMGYAWASTTVVLSPPAQPNVYGPTDDLTVNVTHQLNLPVPFANMLFRDPNVANGAGYYTTVYASCTLNNEGVIDTIQEDSFAAPAAP